MTSIEQLKELCDNRMKELNLISDIYCKRYNQELKDLEYWQEYKKTDMANNLLKQKDYAKNSNVSGSLICFLLNISTIDPIKNNIRERKTTLVAGDCPDIDTDFDPRYRDWVKEHISETFGKENICSIGSYVTYKTRAVIVDVARALGKDVHEIQDITKEMDPLGKYSTEDDEGNEEETKLDYMSFDELKKQFPRLKEYLDLNPDVERFALILRNQVKNMGKHAGGVIISNLNLVGEIPVLRDKSGTVVSTWTEGMGGRELSSIGLVKYDILGCCLEENTLIKTTIGDVAIKELGDIPIAYLNNLGEIKYTSEYLVLESGIKDIIEITLEDGQIIKCSKEHRFFKKN